MQQVKVSAATTVSGFNKRMYCPVACAMAWLLALENGYGVVGRVIIHHKDLGVDLLQSLANRQQGLLQEITDVVTNKDDRKLFQSQ
jgi:hypothetical protein